MFLNYYLVSSLQCYSCNSYEPNCNNPTPALTQQIKCVVGQTCYTTTLFNMKNSSAPLNRFKPDSITRECRKAAQGICDINNEKYGPCFKSDKAINCYHCCSEDRCNAVTPTFNGASLFDVSFCLLLIILFYNVLIHIS